MATNEEKIKIASSFLKAAPPDVRALVADDELLEGGILPALEAYNTEELATIEVPGITGKVIVSKYGQIDTERFLDPKTGQVFTVDHFRQTASAPEPHERDEEIEELRKTIEADTDAYVADRFADGVSAVYGAGGVITIAIVHNRYSPSNYWQGTLKCKVHYYEDGNVQLETSKEIEEKLTKTTEDPHKVLSKAFLDVISSAETKYQMALNENYHELAENTFNGLRRALPYTRTKIDWNKILTYRIGAELAAK
ncbi:F-actin-capping protein subunit alpha-1 [Podila epigama]|nr:F-actin-capping protein subunit alpha-1 [Podila epigama]